MPKSTKKYNPVELWETLESKFMWINRDTMLLGADPSTKYTGLALSSYGSTDVVTLGLPMSQFGAELPGWLAEHVGKRRVILLSEFSAFARGRASSIAVGALEREIRRIIPRQSLQLRIAPVHWRKRILRFTSGRKALKEASMFLTGLYPDDIADAECVRRFLEIYFKLALQAGGKGAP